MKYLRTAVLLSLMLVPAVAFAAPRTFQELAQMIAYLLDNATIVLVVAGIAVYFYGISINILKFGQEGMEKVKLYFFWGVIILFLMVSIWGVLRLLQNTLFGGDQSIQGSASSQSNSAFQSQNMFEPPAFQP